MGSLHYPKGMATMNPIDSNVPHTVSITFFDSTAIASDGNCAPAIITKDISKPDKNAAWKLIKDSQRKASRTATIALINIDVYVDGVLTWGQDYSDYNFAY